MLQTAAIGFLAKSSRFLTGLLGFAFRIRLMFLVVCFLLVNGIILGVESKDATVAINDIGERIFTPTVAMQQQSLRIIERGGVYQTSPNLYKNIWNLILDVWEAFANFWLILMWISVLSKIALHFIIFDASKTSVSYIIGFIFFIGIQMVYVSFSGKGDIMQPITAMWDFVRAVPYFVKSGTSYFEEFVPEIMIDNSTI